MKDSNWENACRIYFSGNPDLWKLRNEIKQHPCAKLLSIPHTFSHIRKNCELLEPTGNKRDLSIQAAQELLNLLNHIFNLPYIED